MARILLVDDNQDLLMAMTACLEDTGHLTTQATNGNDALRLVDSSHFDLVITDIVMPEKEGIETILELRQLFPLIKIIAMSGGDAAHPQTNLHMAQLLGAYTTLNKPFTGDQLKSAISTALQASA